MNFAIHLCMKLLIGLILFFSCYANSALQCKSLLEQIDSPKPSISSAARVSQFKNDLENSSVKDFLTEEFIAQLESEIGPVKKTIKFYDSQSDWSSFQANLKFDFTHARVKEAGYDYGLSVKIEVKKYKVMEFILLFNKGMVKCSVENLSLQNPLNTNDHLHLSQKNLKGISMQDFSKSVKFVKSFLASHKLQQLVNGSSQNLLVSFLYRRLVGMKATEKSTETLKYFDYLLSKTNISVNEMNKSLGDINGASDADHIAKTMNVKISELGRIINHESFTPIYIENNIIGYKFLKDQAEPRYLFLDPRGATQKTFMTWRDLNRDNRLILKLNL